TTSMNNPTPLTFSYSVSSPLHISNISAPSNAAMMEEAGSIIPIPKLNLSTHHVTHPHSLHHLFHHRRAVRSTVPERPPLNNILSESLSHSKESEDSPFRHLASGSTQDIRLLNSRSPLMSFHSGPSDPRDDFLMLPQCALDLTPTYAVV